MGLTLTNVLLLIIAVAQIVTIILLIVWRNRPLEAPNKYQPNLYAALRDVFIAGMQKGQLPVTILGIVLIIIFIRIPADKIQNIVNSTLSVFAKTGALGWVVALTVVILAFLARVMRTRVHKSEVSILKNEKEVLEHRLETCIEENRRLTGGKAKK